MQQRKEPKEWLKQIKTFMLDLDGTVYLGNRLFPWTVPFLTKVKEQGNNYIFVTNNSSKQKADYLKKLQAMGIDVQSEQIFTSGEATRYYLKKNRFGKRIYLLGTPALEDEFQSDGYELTATDPEAVVLGFDMTLTYEKMRIACDLIRRGVPFIATHPDFNCPTPEGPIPDCGAMIAFIKASTGVDPKVIGKPHPEMVEALCVKFGLETDKVAMIGDRLYTDIAMGQQAGILSILVLSGETQPGDLEGSPFKPDLIAENLGEIAEWL